MEPVALDGKPKSTVKSDCAAEPKTQAQRSVISFQLGVFRFGEEKPKNSVKSDCATLGFERGVVEEGDLGVRLEFVVVTIGEVGAVVAATAFLAG